MNAAKPGFEIALQLKVGGGSCCCPCSPTGGAGAGLGDGFLPSPETAAAAMNGIPPVDAPVHPWVAGTAGFPGGPHPDLASGGLANTAALAQLGAVDANMAGTVLTGGLAGGMKAGAQQTQLLANVNPLMAGLNDAYAGAFV